MISLKTLFKVRLRKNTGKCQPWIQKKKKKEEEEEKAENNQIQKAKTTIFYHRNLNKCQDKIRSF